MLGIMDGARRLRIWWRKMVVSRGRRRARRRVRIMVLPVMRIIGDTELWRLVTYAADRADNQLTPLV
jgi:hypothetical protein